MDRSVQVFGYAKINLHLDITGRREDGYHTVNTVMQTLSLCDEVTVLNFGTVLAQGDTKTALNDPEVIKAYIGG